MRTWQPETRLWRRRDRPSDNAGTPTAPSKQRAEYTSTILVVDGRVSGERYHLYASIGFAEAPTEG